MKYLAGKLPKYFEPLVAAVLVVMVVQYALITGALKPEHPVFSLLQIACYLLLAVAVYRGIVQRSRLAWLVVQIMLMALFAFSVLFSGVCAVLAAESGNLWPLLSTALLTAVLNGLLMGFLFALPVCDCFVAPDADR